MNRKSRVLTLLFFTISLVAFSQPYLKYHTVPNLTDRLKDMVAPSREGYMALTETRLLWMDNQGEIVRQWAPQNPGNTSLEKVVVTSNGNFCVLAVRPDRGLELYFIQPDGTLLNKKEIVIANPYFLLKMKPGNDGKIYLSCVIEAAVLKLQVMQLNEDGRTEWVKMVPDAIHFNYDILESQDGGLEAAFLTAGNMVLKMLRFEQDGTYTGKDITGMSMDDADFPALMVRRPDGGYLMAGYQFWGIRSGDVSLMLLDASGKIEQRRVVDIKFDDYPVDLHCDRDGFFLLTQSGMRQNGVGISGSTDFVLTRFDLAGNTVWKKGYGHFERQEVATKLLVIDDRLVMGGYTIKEGEDLPGTLLIGTGMDGDLKDDLFPRQLESTATLKRIVLDHHSWTDELTTAVPAADGGYICGGKFIINGGDDYFASIFKINAQGAVQWLHTPGEILNSHIVSLKPTTDGNYIALVRLFHEFKTFDNLCKISGDGKVIWEKLVGNLTARDVCATPDGGYLVTGSGFAGSTISLTLQKLNANGDEQWIKNYATRLPFTEGSRIGIDANSKVVVAGVSGPTPFTNKALFLLKTELDGTMITEKIVSSADSVYVPTSLLLTTDKEVLIGGYAHPDNSLSKNALLVNFNAAGEKSWLRNFDISLTDEVTALLQMGFGGYYFAGTTNEPELGSRKKISFVSTIRKDGSAAESYYFGDQQSELAIMHLFKGEGNRVHFLANRFEQYHTSFPVTGVVEPNIILSSGTPPNSGDGSKLYPNPARNYASFAMNNQYHGDLSITVIATNGQRLKNIIVKKNTVNAIFRLPLTGIPAGMYQVEVKFGQEILIKPLVVNQ